MRERGVGGSGASLLVCLLVWLLVCWWADLWAHAGGGTRERGEEIGIDGDDAREAVEVVRRFGRAGRCAEEDGIGGGECVGEGAVVVEDTDQRGGGLGEVERRGHAGVGACAGLDEEHAVAGLGGCEPEGEVGDGDVVGLGDGGQ